MRPVIKAEVIIVQQLTHPLQYEWETIEYRRDKTTVTHIHCELIPVCLSLHYSLFNKECMLFCTSCLTGWLHCFCQNDALGKLPVTVIGKGKEKEDLSNYD